MSLTVLAPIGRDEFIEFHVDTLLQRKHTCLNEAYRRRNLPFIVRRMRLVFVM